MGGGRGKGNVDRNYGVYNVKERTVDYIRVGATKENASPVLRDYGRLDGFVVSFTIV